jgi:hypothetical protein
MSELIISPKTKVLELIEAYPQLEPILMDFAPAFRRLTNPALRKTIGRIATLQQAASIGDVKVEDLVNHLRGEVGQDQAAIDASGSYITEQPDWFSDEGVEASLDIRAMLAAGEQPVNQVMADLKVLSQGKIYKVMAPFLPAPLIDKATSLNFKHWIDQVNEDAFIVYFYKDT